MRRGSLVRGAPALVAGAGAAGGYAVRRARGGLGAWWRHPLYTPSGPMVKAQQRTPTRASVRRDTRWRAHVRSEGLGARFPRLTKTLLKWM